MQLRSVILASALHGALIFGVGMGVHRWQTAAQPPIQVAVVPFAPESDVATDPEIAEDVVAEETSDPSFAEPEWIPPTPRPAAEAPAVVEEPEPVYSSPARIAAKPELRIRIRRVPSPPLAVAAEPAAVTPAAYVEAVALDEQNRPPSYPSRARRRGVEGDVVLLVIVDAKGEVRKVELLQSAGLTAAHKALDRAAIAAICQWRYAPALRAGRAVEAKIEVPIAFRLRDL